MKRTWWLCCEADGGVAWSTERHGGRRKGGIWRRAFGCPISLSPKQLLSRQMLSSTKATLSPNSLTAAPKMIPYKKRCHSMGKVGRGRRD